MNYENKLEQYFLKSGYDYGLSYFYTDYWKENKYFFEIMMEQGYDVDDTDGWVYLNNKLEADPAICFEEYLKYFGDISIFDMSLEEIADTFGWFLI